MFYIRTIFNMHVAIIYASNSGSTFQVAEIIAATLRANQHSVNIVNADNFDVRKTSHYDLIVLGSPSWRVKRDEGSPHEAILTLMDRFFVRNLKNQKFAVFGCGDTSYTQFCGAVDTLEKYLKTVGARIVAPSLRIDGFYFNLNTSQKLSEVWVNNLLRNL